MTSNQNHEYVDSSQTTTLTETVSVKLLVRHLELQTRSIISLPVMNCSYSY